MENKPNLPKYRIERVLTHSSTSKFVSEEWYIQVFESRPILGVFRRKPDWYYFLRCIGGMDGNIYQKVYYDSYNEAQVFIRLQEEQDSKYAKPYKIKSEIFEL